MKAQTAQSITTIFISIAAPFAAWTFLDSLGDPRIDAATSDPNTRACISIFLQACTTFAALVSAIIAAFYTVKDKNASQTEMRLAEYSFLLMVVLLLIFGFGHGREPNMLEKYQGAKISLPPFNSWLTWMRITVGAFGALSAFFEPISKALNRSKKRKKGSGKDSQKIGDTKVE